MDLTRKSIKIAVRTVKVLSMDALLSTHFCKFCFLPLLCLAWLYSGLGDKASLAGEMALFSSGAC